MRTIAVLVGVLVLMGACGRTEERRGTGTPGQPSSTAPARSEEGVIYALGLRPWSTNSDVNLPTRFRVPVTVDQPRVAADVASRASYVSADGRRYAAQATLDRDGKAAADQALVVRPAMPLIPDSLYCLEVPQDDRLRVVDTERIGGETVQGAWTTCFLTGSAPSVSRVEILDGKDGTITVQLSEPVDLASVNSPIRVRANGQDIGGCPMQGSSCVKTGGAPFFVDTATFQPARKVTAADNPGVTLADGLVGSGRTAGVGGAVLSAASGTLGATEWFVCQHGAGHCRNFVPRM